MPPGAYYDLFDDTSTSNRWYLDSVAGASGEWLGVALSSATRFDGPVPLTVGVYRPGPPLELTIADDELVVNERVARILDGVASADIQLVPTVISDHPEQYFVVNMLYEPDCIDERRTTDARRYTAEDGYPDRIGRFKCATGMKIDPARTGGHDIFRPWGWAVAIVVSAKVADTLRKAGVRCTLRFVS